MIKVYGYSDDNLVIEGAPYPADEISCFEEEVQVWFSDGTIIRCGYPKEGKAIWWIKVLVDGTGESKLTVCDDEDADVYSDVFEIDAEYVKHMASDENEDVADLRNIFAKMKKEYAFGDIQQAYEDIFE